MYRYLVNNNKESEWIQLYLFSKGYSWRWHSDNLLVFRSLDYPIIIEERDGKIYWKYFVTDKNISNKYFVTDINIINTYHVNNMMRKDKIKLINNIK